MAITEMSLPIDIPWKRMGVSKDMIDLIAGNLTFPQKWRSSISVFYHEPTELPPDYCNRKVTYLKIICTITNYQIEGDDVTVLGELKKKYGEFYAWKDFDAKVTQSFPCYGALMQVGVYPHPSFENPGANLHNYPYISVFQPRKREMYEVLTESGEVTSQSGNKLNILKGTTNTDTTEDYDLDLGGGGGGHSGVFGLWSEQHTDPNKQVGTIERSQTENQNVTSKDASREKRESHAYSTNINQLYTMLQGYHLGTNRAIFFMQPRPHMQDQKFTFIRGLRRLEGIQEFFLIVDRPASVEGICVEVALETAHAYLERAYEPHLIPLSELYAPGNLNKTGAALGINVGVPPYSFPGGPSDLVSKWNLTTPLDKLYAAAWPQLPPELANHTVPINIGALLMVVEQVPGIGIEDIALIFEEYESDSGYFFVTGRRLCACVTPMADHEGEGENVDCEQSSEDHISTCDTPSRTVVVSKRRYGRSTLKRKSLEGASRGADLNATIQDLNEALWSSLGSTTRFPYGEVSFLETDFILDELSQLMRLLKKGGIQDRPLEEVDSMRPFINQGLGRVSKVRNILDLGTLSTTLISRDLGVSEAEARKVRRDLLLASLEALDAVTLKVDAIPENPIRERFATEFPEDRLRELERSARGAVDKSPRPEKTKRTSPRPKKKQ